ncbi:hypothetical protein IX306_000798 [Porphyromonas levii]|uniref:hypothetical protein n=1 Tax=Porphyromonas levii TaxID=28114 RepID=UPI001BA6E42B|nr:hypothetical protein [Porphyromonas levii]MBR8773685.1 hypothetical protein [Porphyromonas levii]
MSEERVQISMSNTKKEMLDAYEALLKEVTAKNLEHPKEEQKRVEQKKVVSKAEALSIEELEGFAQEVMGEFGKAVAVLQRQLKEGFDKLSILNDTIKIKEEWIEDLYAIQSNADSLSTLILAQKRRKEEVQQELDAERMKLEAEIANTREIWKREKDTHNESLKQEKADIALQRKREEEEYNYTTNQRRRAEEDEFRARLLAEEKSLEERKKAFEREYADREKILKEAEAELSQLRELSESLSGKIEEAETRAIAVTEERLNREHRFEFDLAKKETEGQLKLKDQQIELLQQKISEMELQLKEAGVKVANSEETVKDIAFRAIESSTLSHRTFAREQRLATLKGEGAEEI